jgi:hypothetical protein
VQVNIEEAGVKLPAALAFGGLVHQFYYSSKQNLLMELIGQKLIDLNTART